MPVPASLKKEHFKFGHKPFLEALGTRDKAVVDVNATEVLVRVIGIF